MPRLTQTRAADNVALGGIFKTKTIALPVPGGPEVLTGLGCAGACGCKGTCGMGHDGLSGIVDTITGLSPAAKIAGAVGLYFLYKRMKKRR